MYLGSNKTHKLLNRFDISVTTYIRISSCTILCKRFFNTISDVKSSNVGVHKI